jgi:hypothetical protein
MSLILWRSYETLLALATLGDATQMEMILYVLCDLRWPREEGQHDSAMKSQMFSPKQFANVKQPYLSYPREPRCSTPLSLQLWNAFIKANALAYYSKVLIILLGVLGHKI